MKQISDFSQYFNEEKWQWNVDRYVCCSKDTDNEYSEVQSDDMIKVEDSSWWFEYRIKILRMLAERFFDDTMHVFDIGGGNGVMSKALLKDGYEPILLEPSKYCCNNALRRGIANVYQGTLNDENLKDSSIAQFMINDVLEHIDDDRAFVKLLYKKTKSDGIGIVMVPALKCLWSSEDSFDGHFRRYNLSEMVKIMEEVGFKVLHCNYFFQWLFIPILVIRVWGEKFGIVKRHELRTEDEAQEMINKQFVTNKSLLIDAVLSFFMNHELKKIMSKSIKYGSSLLIVVKKS